MQDLFFSPGWALFPPLPRPGRRRTIYPVFLSFSGCPQRCLFCAQDAQTGRAPAAVAARLAQEENRLERLANDGVRGLELAFFGGTFTALPKEDLFLCLAFYRRWAALGLFSSFRCSTRPDAVSPALLDEIGRAGCAMVELGVQSFHDAALTRSRRGYSGQTAREACAMVARSGLSLGVQLMPGMPGLCHEDARRDVLEALAHSPACARLYPCQVISGTRLAEEWRAGLYAPWNLDETLDYLAWACAALENAGCAVIRMGLCEEEGLAEHILAGPRHPELGNMARGLALYRHVRAHILQWEDASGQKAEKALLLAPRRVQGMFWGHARAREAAYAALGLRRNQVLWQDRDDFLIGVPGSGVSLP